MSYQVLHGDVIEMMKTLADNSVDAVVTDPPYGLEFMGKEWDAPWKSRGDNPASAKFTTGGFVANNGYKDRKTPSYGKAWRNKRCQNCNHIASGGSPCQCDNPVWMSEGSPNPAAHMQAFQDWCEIWAVECLRVLKPGGHLLSFGGSRTYHRMACAVEDAGFEIRDQIMWLHGQGFPKSLNLDRERGENFCGCEEISKHNLRFMRQPNLPQAINSTEKQKETVQQEMSKQGLSTDSRKQLPSTEIWSGEQGVEGGSYTATQEGKLRVGEVCSVSDMGAADGSEGWICDGASPSNGQVVRISSDSGGSRSSPKPQTIRERTREFRDVAGQQKPQISGAWDICDRCGLPMVSEGFGTALKPAHEPIVLARKPLIGTVAANVLLHGTGALNIAACRIPGEPVPINKLEAWSGFGQEIAPEYTATMSDVGRWPANLIHDGSKEVLEEFPDTTSGGSGLNGVGTEREIYGTYQQRIGGQQSPSVGTAARFFYCAKADREDRNEGCEDFDKKPLNWSSGTQSPGTFQAEGTDRSSRNNHPTVKPTDLMRYLCKMITPPGGTILDPFMGSGSTGKAALYEGFNFIGIEKEAEYCAIAKARMDYVLATDVPLLRAIAAVEEKSVEVKLPELTQEMFNF